jgi:hypothetical protein
MLLYDKMSANYGMLDRKLSCDLCHFQCWYRYSKDDNKELVIFISGLCYRGHIRFPSFLKSDAARATDFFCHAKVQLVL